MLDWFSVLCANIASVLFWPLLLATIPVGMVIFHAFGVRDRTDYASLENNDARWRIWASVQGLLIGWLAWGLLSAVPQPDFKTKIVEKEVVKWREKLVMTNDRAKVYQTVYDRCAKELDGKLNAYEWEERCSKKAEKLSSPSPKIKYVYKADPYKDLMNTCMSRYAVDIVQERDQRLQMCHEQSMEVRAKIL